jgi:CheY-like chemotaxis protein
VREQRPVILLLEDHEQARFVIRAVLEGAGYGVIDATNEDDAMAICGRVDQRIDAMVSDVILSSARGTDVAQSIKSLRPALPILFVSGFGMDDLVSRGLLESDHLPSGRVSFLQKPFLPQTLLGTVERLFVES